MAEWRGLGAGGEPDGGGVDQQSAEADEQAHGGSVSRSLATEALVCWAVFSACRMDAGLGHEGVEDGGSVGGGGDDLGQVDQLVDADPAAEVAQRVPGLLVRQFGSDDLGVDELEGAGAGNPGCLLEGLGR